MDIEVYIAQTNNIDNKIVNFTHEKGVSNHDLSKEKMNLLEKGKEYLLCVKDKNSNTVLYAQKVSFSNFEIDSIYYHTGFIQVYNAVSKISDLTIYDSYGNAFIVDEEFQELDNENHILWITMPNEFFPGYYYIYYNGEEFGKFFLVYGLESFTNLNAFNIYPISGKNNVIITSSMYYLPDIFRIEIIRNVNDVNETFIYTNENIIYKNNDYLKFTLPEYNDELEIPTYILSTIYGYDTFGDEIELKVDIVLEYDNPIDFSLNKNYQISMKKKILLFHLMINTKMIYGK